jgi:hypothetical protein
MNELTFVARLGSATSVRAERRRARGQLVLIATGDIEEREIHPKTKKLVRCDMRLASPSGQRLVSGEFKRPEHPDGRDPRSENLRADARAKALARGLPFYFTCNMAQVVLYAPPIRPGDNDREIGVFDLAPLTKAVQAERAWETIESGWAQFLEALEERLGSLVVRRPSVTREGVVVLKREIDRIVDECLPRARERLTSDRGLCERTRVTTKQAFGLVVALNPKQPVQLAEELAQILRLSVFVVVQKLILYRVLLETGPRRASRFSLDPLTIPEASTDPALVRQVIKAAVNHAIQRSGDYETAFLLTPNEDLLFSPTSSKNADACAVGRVWAGLALVVQDVSWQSISQNLVGFLYETIIEPRFRHQLGQYYTPDDVVDLLVTFAVRDSRDLVLDPASGGGGFLCAAYRRKVALGGSHEDTLAELWGCEVTAFAAQLTSITLATANTEEAAAYPRVLLRDFFTTRPGGKTTMEIPGVKGTLPMPACIDAVVGNPPYISYRRQTNQHNVAKALGDMRASGIALPIFTGKSDEYVWFLVHATQYLGNGGRLGFVVSSALLFSDYGVPLVRFLGRHYRIVAVVDSLVEQWFEDADTNTVLLMLERNMDARTRESSDIRFVRFRQPLSRLLPDIDDAGRRDAVEHLVEEFTGATPDIEDPRFQVRLVRQGEHGGLEFRAPEAGGLLGGDEEHDEKDDE